MLNSKKKVLLAFIFLFVTTPALAAADVVGQRREFFVDHSYDSRGREEVSAILLEESRELYIYVDESWLSPMSEEDREELEKRVKDLAHDFDNTVYPKLRPVYGREWVPGIDEKTRVTVVVHPMKKEAGGYFRSDDEYRRSVVPGSNQREMLYLDTESVSSPLALSYLAHEFTHLVTFNQKNRLQGVQEERWLNELRAEYAPTLVGLEKGFEGTNLERRKNIFRNFPSDPLTEWKNKRSDYGVINIFGQYLVEKYGVEILSSSLRSSKPGIEGLNTALEQEGTTFSQTFLDFLVTVYANDCSLGEKYCFERKGLENLSVTPQVNFLPLSGSSSLGVSQQAKNWEGNWYKFTGGRKGALKLQFIGDPQEKFRVLYLVRDFSGGFTLHSLPLSETQKGKILVPGLGTEVSSVTLIPVVTTKKKGFSGKEENISFFWEATTITEKEELEKEKKEGNSSYIQRPFSEMSRGEILAKIQKLQNLINELQRQLHQLEGSQQGQGRKVGQEIDLSACRLFEPPLRQGMKGEEVSCLQEFLKSRGEQVYPEGLVTGYFGPLTERAVIRFQEKHQQEVLAPWDLEKGTGFVGRTTTRKINELF